MADMGLEISNFSIEGNKMNRNRARGKKEFERLGNEKGTELEAEEGDGAMKPKKTETRRAEKKN